MENKLLVDTNDNTIVITGDTNKIVKSRRAYRLLRDVFVCEITNDSILIRNIENFNHALDTINQIGKLCDCKITYSVNANQEVVDYKSESEKFFIFSQKAQNIKNNNCNLDDILAFKNALINNMSNRTLYDLQLLSAYHLAFSQNGCNFSVPGAGKTSIVYGAYTYLHSLAKTNSKYVDKLMIIGPLSAFSPWELEFEECFGRKPKSKRLIGNISLEEKRQYLFDENEADLILISYASVVSLVTELNYFLKKYKVMVVLDEAHKIKNTSGGIISQSVLSLAVNGNSRVVLTGTPAPNGYEDLSNLFRFIWPNKKIIRFQTGQLKDMTKHVNDPRIPSLIEQISPYFIRIRKSDLKIPKATINPPIVVEMGSEQRNIYEFIEKKYMGDILDSCDKSFKSSLVKARMIRLMQVSTNPSLLKKPLSAFAEAEGIDLSLVNENDSNIINAIKNYAETEIPAKFIVAGELAKSIESKGGRVIIWACYIDTIKALSAYLFSVGIFNKILYGGTPIASDGITPEDAEYELTREAIVAQFNDLDSDLNVVIANPFAVAESISLHKACHNAIYLERSFNAAHFIQSKDRIHRYGLQQGTETNYYYLVSKDSVDETINERLDVKERRLIEIMENMPIPLFDNTIEEGGNEDIKAVLKDYARRIKTE